MSIEKFIVVLFSDTCIGRPEAGGRILSSTLKDIWIIHCAQYFVEGGFWPKGKSSESALTRQLRNRARTVSLCPIHLWGWFLTWTLIVSIQSSIHVRYGCVHVLISRFALSRRLCSCRRIGWLHNLVRHCEGLDALAKWPGAQASCPESRRLRSHASICDISSYISSFSGAMERRPRLQH